MVFRLGLILPCQPIIAGKIQAALEEELKTLKEKLEELQNSELGKTIDREIVIDLVDGKRISDPNIPDEFGQSILEKKGGEILQMMRN
ncbi:MAG: hypothetical protein ACKPGX_03170 [Dolichospermum sp.]